jgi:uncharacterized protein
METKQTLETALRDAMRANNEVAKRTLRMVISSIKLAEIEKSGPLDEAGLMSILQKEIKSRRESISEAEKANRPDLVESSQAEITVLDAFLPKQLSEEELTEIVKTVIQETNASAPTDMGKVMKALMPRLQGKAAGDLVSRVVKNLLAG